MLNNKFIKEIEKYGVCLLVSSILFSNLHIKLVNAQEVIKKEEIDMDKGNEWGYMKVEDYLESLPEDSEKAILDRTLVAMPTAGARVVRHYKPTATHYHVGTSAIMYILSGKGKFIVEDGNEVIVVPGTVIYWKAGITHELKEIIEGPIDAIIFDIGNWNTEDIIYTSPKNPINN